MEEWDVEIKPKTGWLNLNLKEVWRYRDLLLLFVRRDFVAEYKQTILGPLWYLIQPIFTAFTYLFILNKAGGMPTDGLPPMLFYLSGLTIWGYFATSLTKIADTFISNAHIFGKVYFPRLIVPFSVILSNLIRLGLQFMLLCFFIVYFQFFNSNYDFHIELRPELLLLPLPIFLMAGYSFGFGLLISSMTTKYRDLKFALTFGIQLLMFGSSVIISINTIPENFRNILKWNPIANIVEFFRAIIMQNHPIHWNEVGYSFFVLIFIVFLGIVIFNKTEKNFMDTV